VKSKEKQKVLLQMANKAIFESAGYVETIEADFNNETGNIAFRAAFPNPKRILRHGETGNIMMPIQLKKAILIPQKSTFDVLDKKYVYVVDEKGVITSSQITIAEEIPHFYILSSGLKPSDKILLEGLGKVKNNEKIKYKFVSLEKELAEIKNIHAE
jgi:membrane fusion protein (multidrug efflux system)